MGEQERLWLVQSGWQPTSTGWLMAADLWGIPDFERFRGVVFSTEEAMPIQRELATLGIVRPAPIQNSEPLPSHRPVVRLKRERRTSTKPTPKPKRWIDFLLQQELRYRRRVLWIKRTGLPPPDDRGFVPRRDSDERPAKLNEKHEQRKQAANEYSREIMDGLVKRAKANRQDGGYPRRPTWSLPARPDDAPPSWDNVVRAYEEDR